MKIIIRNSASDKNRRSKSYLNNRASSSRLNIDPGSRKWLNIRFGHIYYYYLRDIGRQSRVSGSFSVGFSFSK